MCARYRVLAVVLLVSFLSTACGSVEPTVTSVPATATQITLGATDTPLPTTATHAPPTATPVPATPTAPVSSPLPGGGGGGGIAFYSERDGNTEIYTMNADGSDQRRLTFNRFDDSSPVWSPDASQIAFLSDRDDPQSGDCFPRCFFQLYLINADGSGEHKLVETEFSTLHPDWHPDGSRLSFDTEFNLQGDIYVVGADGRGLQLLIEDGFWADWSPDGTQIAFASNRDGSVEIYVADADGRNQRRLTENTTLDFFPAWSPDGQRIAFAKMEQKQIYVMDADGRNEQQLTYQGHCENPDWSPDGAHVAFQSSSEGNFEIYTIHVEDALQGGEGSSSRRLTDNPAGDLWPSWGPAVTSKPDSIRFEKSAQTFAAIPTYQIGLADLDGDGDLDAVFSNGQANDSEVWLNDGGGFFVDSGQQLGKYGHGVNVGDLDGDDDPDLLINTHRDSAPTRVYLNDGHAVFQEMVGAFDHNIGFNVHLLDIDGDADLDAVGEDTYSADVYLNDGAGYFGVGEVTFPLTTAWGDLDQDGDIDVLIKEVGVGYSVELNDGTGRFSPYWNHLDPEALDLGDMALADVDDDGDLDAIITNGHFQATAYPAMVFVNDSTGQFADSGQRLSAPRNAGLDLGDVDGDGDLDLVLTDYMEPCQIWLNDGDGQFADSGFRFGDDQFYRHVHLGDLDGDGDLDIFLATFGTGNGPNEIWFNNTPRGESTVAEEDGLYLGQRPPGLDMEVFAPGVVSIEEGKEYKIAISPDLQEIFFTRRTPGRRDDRLWYSRMENGELATPELAPFATDSLESDACFTPDGKRLYFNSQRPLPGEEAQSAHLNVWFVDKTEDGWSDPQFLGPPLNDYRPVYFSIADDGTIYFTRSNPREIWYAELEDGQYLEAQRLPDEINDLVDVAHPAIARDESYIVVDSCEQPRGRLVCSLFISFRQEDGVWTQAVSLRDALGASDSNVHASPRITPDGKYLLFEEYEKETDKSDIYWVSTEVFEEIRSVTTLPPTATPETSAQGFLLTGVGFETPESVLYDPEGDVYLVANIYGNPSNRDGNGFISRISPEGEVIALKWIDGAAESVALFTLNAPKGMALSGDGLFVADIDVVRVFDRKTGTPLDEIPVAGARFLNDVAAAEDGTVYVTDSGTGVVHRILPDGSLEQAGQVENPNGIQVRGETILVTGGNNQIFRLGDHGSLPSEYEAPAGGLDGLILLSDGRVLVSSWSGSAVYQFDADGQVSELFSGINAPADIGFDTKRNVVLIPYFEDDRVEAKPLSSPDAPLLAEASVPVLDAISIDTADQVELLHSLSGHSDRVMTLAFSGDGAHVASSSQDKTIKLWDVVNWQEVHAFSMNKAGFNGIAFSPDGLLLASADAIWDVKSRQVVHTLERGRNDPGPVAFSPDGSLLAVAQESRPIKLWDVASGEVLRTFKGRVDDVTFSVAFSPDGALLAAGVHGGMVRLWDVARGQVASTLEYGNESDVHDVAFSPDGELLASASNDDTVRLWDVASGQPVHILRHGNGLYGVALSPDGRLVASACCDRTVKLWDVASGRLVRSLPHGDELMTVAFSADGALLVSAGYDHLVYVWGISQ